jgi:hypothetical protein
MAPQGYNDINIYFSDLTSVELRGKNHYFGPGTSLPPTSVRYAKVAALGVHWAFEAAGVCHEVTSVNYRDVLGGDVKVDVQHPPLELWKSARSQLHCKYECMKVGITKYTTEHIARHGRSTSL